MICLTLIIINPLINIFADNHWSLTVTEAVLHWLSLPEKIRLHKMQVLSRTKNTPAEFTDETYNRAGSIMFRLNISTIIYYLSSLPETKHNRIPAMT